MEAGAVGEPDVDEGLASSSRRPPRRRAAARAAERRPSSGKESVERLEAEAAVDVDASGPLTSTSVTSG